MTRLRTHWLAALGASLLLTLSVSTAFGAHPETSSTENRGQQVSAYVHSLLLGNDQDPEEQTDEEQDEDEQSDEEQASDEQTTEDDGAANHGQCVREVAWSDEVGEPNDNHGGAVNLAARETCWQADTSDEGGEEGDGSDTPTEVSDGPGNSENRGSHGKGHH